MADALVTRLRTAGALGLLAVFALAFSSGAHASDEKVSLVRQPSGRWLAVVYGLQYNACCSTYEPPFSVSIKPGEIRILPSPICPACYLPIFPPLPYRREVDLGPLADGRYFVAFGSATTYLNVGIVVPVPIPTLSGRLPLSLALILAVTGGFGARKRIART